MAKRELAFDDATADRLDRLLLLHMWGMAPFAIPWFIWPHRFGTGTPDQAQQMRLLFVLLFGLLVIRTYLVLTRNRSFQWNYVWPIADIAVLAGAITISNAPSDSWVVALFVLPVLTAATTLNLGWAIAVAILGAGACLLTQGTADLQYAYGAFRLFFLLVVASLATRVAQEVARNQRRLALAESQADLAREAHDGLQQILGAMTMRLELAERLRTAQPEKALDIAIEQKELARRANDELRLMIRRLRAEEHIGGSLYAGLMEQANLFSQRCEAKIDVTSAGDPCPLPPQVEHALLRIAGEALNNVAKHAEATHVELALRFTPAETTLTVADDGKGGAVAREEGLGLASMADRAALIGARFDIKSEPREGTFIQVTVPNAKP